MSDFNSNLHPVDVIITVACNGKYNDSFWLACYTCEEQFIIMRDWDSA